MKKYKFYKPLLWKRYVDVGFGLLGQLKYLVGIIGVGSLIEGVSYKWVLLGGFLYLLSCFILGKIWLKKGLYETEQEITNNFNPFVYEMRNSKIFK